MKIARTTDVTVELSPEDVADCFCDLYSDEQAIFFNRIAEVTATWNTRFCIQVESIIDSNMLTNGGKKIMLRLGEFDEGDI